MFPIQKKAWNALIFWDTDIELLNTSMPHFKVDVNLNIIMIVNAKFYFL